MTAPFLTREAERELTFVPRRKLAAALEDGWRLVEGHDYHERDWAVLVERGTIMALSEAETAIILALFADPEPVFADSNKERAAIVGRKVGSRLVCRKGHRKTGANLSILPNGRRRCLACHAAWEREYQMRRRAALKREMEAV